jgi:hypothetical protein
MADKSPPLNPGLDPLKDYVPPEFHKVDYILKESAKRRNVNAPSRAEVVKIIEQSRRISGKTEKELEEFIGRVEASANRGGMSYYEALTFGEAGSRVAKQQGFGKEAGKRITEQATGFRKAFSDMVSSKATSLTGKEAGALDAELRVAAANSDLANSLGALVGLAGKVELKGKIDARGKLINLKDLKSEDPKVRKAAIEALSRLGTEELAGELEKVGVSSPMWKAALADTKANKEQIGKNDIQDAVRERQGIEVQSLISNQMVDAIIPTLKAQGIADPRQRREMAMQVGDIIQMEIAKASKAEGATPEKVQKSVANAVVKAIGVSPDRAQDIAAKAMQRGEDLIKADPSLAGFKDLTGLVSINRQDILQEGRKQTEADREKVKEDLENVPNEPPPKKEESKPEAPKEEPKPEVRPEYPLTPAQIKESETRKKIETETAEDKKKRKEQIDHLKNRYGPWGIGRSRAKTDVLKQLEYEEEMIEKMTVDEKKGTQVSLANPRYSMDKAKPLGIRGSDAEIPTGNNTFGDGSGVDTRMA